MKKFLMFIAGFITALSLSLVIIHRLIRFMIDILFRLDALDALKEGFLVYLGKAMGLREFEFKPRRRFSYRDYKDAYRRKEEHDESRKEQEV